MPVTTSPVVTPIRPSMPSCGEGLAHLDGRPQRAQRVVLVHDRHAEDRHHRIADELLDRAAVALDDLLHLLEVAGQERPQRLRVEPLAQRGRAGDVAEQHRHRLALLALRRGADNGAAQNGQNGNSPGSSLPQAGHEAIARV